jgi:hypothetical protein
MSDIEGKATRGGASERGQRASFNGADGISDPAAAGPRWVAASEWSRGDASDIDGQTERSKWAGAHESTWEATEFQMSQSKRVNKARRVLFNETR